MSIFNDKALKSVADAVSKVLAQESEGTHPTTEKEKKLAALAHPKDKITHKDVLVGRGVLKKEEAEQIDETPKVDAGLFGNQKRAARAERGDNFRKFETGNTTGGQWKGKTSPSPYKDSQVAKSGERKGLIKKDAIAKTKEAIKSRLNKEETEQVEDEMLQEGFADMEKYMKSKSGPQSSGGAGMKQGHRYGGSKQAPDVEDDEEEKKPARGKYGARQKRAVKEGFCHLLSAYEDGGLKALSENLYLDEEVDNETYTKEVDRQQRKASGTAPDSEKAKVAAPATQGVKSMPEEYVEEEIKVKKNGMRRHTVVHKEDVEQVDELKMKTLTNYLDKAEDEYHTTKDPRVKAKRDKGMDVAIRKAEAKANNRNPFKEDVDQIDERHMTEPEMEKREKIVKSMKKGLSGFKQRYGDRAKSVMYATATKQAMKEDKEEE